MSADLVGHRQWNSDRPSAAGGGVRSPAGGGHVGGVAVGPRLGRSLPHLIETIGELEARGVGFKSVQEHIDTTTPGGRAASAGGPLR